MKTKLEKSEMANMLFFLSLYIYISLSILKRTFYGNYLTFFSNNSILIIVFTLLLIKEIFLNKSDARKIFIFFCVLLLSMLIYIYTNKIADLIVIFIFSYSAKEIEFKIIAKKVSKLLFIILLFVVISSKIGIIPNYIKVEIRMREFLGFLGVLYGPMLALVSFALTVYYKNAKLKIKELLGWTVLNGYIFIKTNSRLSFALALVIVAYCLLLKFSNLFKFTSNKPKKIYSIMVFSFIYCAIISILTAFQKISFSNEFMNLLDSRINLSNSAIYRYGIHLLPQSIEWIGNGLDLNGEVSTIGYNYVDCFYINLLLTYGILLSFFVIVSLTLAVRYAYKNMDYCFVFLMFVFSIQCLIDDLFMRLYFNVFWLAIIRFLLMLFQRNKKVKISM